ncbi:MAG TPA: nuclear transport factor 2 family protein [Bacteroidota bacterium]|nr:nuclear transport factor 2 family protein [Bacteroidota bacterium]
MSTMETVQSYFRDLQEKREWTAYLADDIHFTSYTSPIKEVRGKKAYLDSTRRFYSMVVSLHVRDLIISEEKVCALTRYVLHSPSGSNFVSDVAEIMTVRNGRIGSLSIFFDPAPFPKS